MLEFALVLPILLVLVFAIVKGGFVFLNYLTLTDAVRSGARTLAVGRLPGTYDACTPARAQVRASAGALDQAHLTDADITITLSGSDTCTSLTGGSHATVAVTSYPCDFNIPIIPINLPCTLSASATDRVE
jgi:Flp pilus assembly protein TadG